MPLATRHPRAFTLVELLSTIAILAALTVVGLFSYTSITTWVRQTSDKQTLTVLNDALDRYKTQGGNVNALTAATPISTVLSRLSSTTTWAGISHQFLNTGKTYPSRSIDAMGNRAAFTFYRYNTFTSKTPGFGDPTADQPYGSGIGHVVADENGGQLEAVSDTGWFAVQPNNADLTITDSGFYLEPGVSATFWACVDDGNSTPAGHITQVDVGHNGMGAYGVVAVDISGLRSVTVFDFGNNPNLASLNINGITTFTEVSGTETSLSSFSIANQPDLTSLQMGNNPQLTSLSVSNCPQLTNINTWNSGLTSVTFSGLPALVTFDLTSSNYSDTDLNTLFSALPTVSPATTTIYVGGNPGSDDCDPSIATAKNWIVNTVDT